MLAPPDRPGAMAILIPAWDESTVIAEMLKGALKRLDLPHYRLFVCVYSNDPYTVAAVRQVADPRVTSVISSRERHTTKADCTNHLWEARIVEECAIGIRATDRNRDA